MTPQRPGHSLESVVQAIHHLLLSLFTPAGSESATQSLTTAMVQHQALFQSQDRSQLVEAHTQSRATPERLSAPVTHLVDGTLQLRAMELHMPSVLLTAQMQT